MRLLNLSEEVQNALLEEKISERHARALLSLPVEEQNEWLKKIIAKRMTVRQLDLELKKLKGGDSKEMPSVEQNVNEPVLDIKEDNVESDDSSNGDVSNPPKVPNKFFNFLEDEAANMTMNVEPENDEVKFNIENPVNNEIEVLEDFDVEPTNNVSPLFFNENSNVDNNIIEVAPKTDENIIDPVDMINTLAPDFEEKQKEDAGMDLKSAINDVREFVKTLENRGFTISLDEIDLDGNYQITINIKK